MGVTGLWTVVQPCARPIKLETLNKKRLAVDASIWIYQFLKAVRDQEGNALRNSHIVGFFRRICKLLYFGIRPVFVFDGGAPVLKRQTIAARKKNREGRREDAAQTAGKLLAVQMQRMAEEEAASRRRNKKRQDEEEDIGEPVYVDEAMMTEQEKQKTRKFKKKDAYHLPNMDVSLEEMGAPNDPRIMSQAELEQYAQQFHQGHDINLYDFSKIDFDSPFFLSLPATDRYNILNAARLRSRLRMGYSKEQLDIMFPDRMAFSKFQIERVRERNDLTQRLMNINGMNGEEAFMNSGQRIAGERGREYVLVKDSRNEGGWVLGVVGNKDEGREDKPIDVDQYGKPELLPEPDDELDDDEFEDVPIEGLNRLPKLPLFQEGVFDEAFNRQVQENKDMRRALEESRRIVRKSPSNEPQLQEAEDDSLFVQGDGGFLPEMQGQGIENANEEEDELQQAIALSLQRDEKHDEDVPEIPINRPMDTAELPGPSADLPLDESDDEGMDFGAALAKTKVTKKPPVQNPFSGPLPFEPIKLTKSTADSEKPSDIPDDAGGFVKEPTKAPKKPQDLPPWFVNERVNEEFIVDPTNEEAENKHQHDTAPDHLFLSNRRSPDIIDVDDQSDTKEVVNLEAEEEKEEKKEADTHIEIAPAPTVDEPPCPDVPEKVDAGHVETQSLDKPADTITRFDELPTHVQHTNVQPEPSRAEPSPEPEDEEFEDVLPHPSHPAPEVTVVADRPAELPTEPMFHEAMVEDHGEFSDPEDEELLKQLAAEGEEHVRFTKTLNSAPPNQESFDYEQELKQLRAQQQKDRRDADEVNQIMISECQQLLRLFGLPYITAPMEAEAQCAQLVSLGLVDGIVTDDSDTFLFGGTRVYKNMFNQSKFVECYLTSDFEKEYALHRQKLISFAHLLGSDYTEGIAGIGPVTALEILTEFSSLEEFRDWWTQVQMGVNNPDDAHLAFRKKFRKKASKIFLPPSFPDARVETAYLEPEVDSDPSQFQWGVPDLNGLRHFLMTTIGWSQERTDEVLVPVIRDMNRREQEGTQSNITHFIQGPQGAGAFAPRARAGGTSRMEKAFNRLRREAQTGDRGTSLSPNGDAADGTTEETTKSTGKRGTRKAATGSASKKRKTRTTGAS